MCVGVRLLFSAPHLVSAFGLWQMQISPCAKKYREENSGHFLSPFL
jgi:hypothetical protein